MKTLTLSAQKEGLNRQRLKGGAEGFYTLKNCFITADKTIKSRPGTVKLVTLDAGTKGLFGFGDNLQVFSSESVTVPAGYENNIILHPTAGVAIKRIHYASPIFGRLYVVAEFENGDVFHYWLQEPDEWEASTNYVFGQQVQPTVENGYVYEVTNVDPTISWQANTAKAVGDFVQPTTFNNFKYEAIAVTGTPVLTGDTEPVWPTVAGETVVERRYVTLNNTTSPGTGTSPTPSPPKPSCVVVEAYVADGRQAMDVGVGSTLQLANLDLSSGIGVVTYAETEDADCVTLVTSGGIKLTCSRTAPIGTSEGFIPAPDCMGKLVAVQDGGKAWQQVTEIQDAGMRKVRHITCENAAFWAGDEKGKYMLHHNAKPPYVNR